MLNLLRNFIFFVFTLRIKVSTHARRIQSSVFSIQTAVRRWRFQCEISRRAKLQGLSSEASSSRFTGNTKKRDITSKYIESWWCEKIIYWAVEIAWNAGDDPKRFINPPCARKMLLTWHSCRVERFILLSFHIDLIIYDASAEPGERGRKKFFIQENPIKRV